MRSFCSLLLLPTPAAPTAASSDDDDNILRPADRPGFVFVGLRDCRRGEEDSEPVVVAIM